MATPQEQIQAASNYFDAHRVAWAQAGHEGEWAAVHGTDLLGFFPSLADGYQHGVERFAPGTFIVKQVSLDEDVQIIHRVAWSFLGVQ